MDMLMMQAAMVFMFAAALLTGAEQGPTVESAVPIIQCAQIDEVIAATDLSAAATSITVRGSDRSCSFDMESRLWRCELESASVCRDQSTAPGASEAEGRRLVSAYTELAEILPTCWPGAKASAFEKRTVVSPSEVYLSRGTILRADTSNRQISVSWTGHVRVDTEKVCESAVVAIAVE